MLQQLKQLAIKCVIPFLYGSVYIVSGIVYAAPITFNTALPVAKDQFLLREQLVVTQSGQDPSGENRDRTETAAVTAVGYGIDRQWALFTVLPYRDITLDIDSGGQRVLRNNNGLGDLSMFTRYVVYQDDKPGQTFRVAPFAGFKAPTGSDNVSDDRGILPFSVQVGSGSWDYFAGVVLTWQTLTYQIDTQASYRMNNQANGFESGDIARLDGSFQYRLWRSAAKDRLPDYLYGVLEANWIRQDKNTVNGIDEPDSNGTRLFVSPGIQYVTLRWMVEVAVQIPVSQKLNGTALENDYILRTSVRINL